MVEEHPNSILKELQKRHYKQRGRSSFSAEIIRYALLLPYTSLKNLFLGKFPLPSFSLLEKIQRGGVESIISPKSPLEKAHLSQDSILTIDEVYLQKGTQLHSGEYISSNEEDELYKGIIVFMITGLKIQLSLVIKAWSNRKGWGTFSRDSEMHFSSYRYWIFIRAVNTFNILLEKFEENKKYYQTM